MSGPTDADLDREFAFTSWRESCRDSAITPGGELRSCRRPYAHADEHASGFGEGRFRWPASE